MPLSLEGYAQGVRDLLTEQSEAAAGFTVPEIAGHTPTIMEEFARMIVADPDKRELLKPATPLSGNVAGGFYDLAPHLIAPDNLMLEFIQMADIRTDPDDLGTAFHWKAEHGQLRMKLPTDSMFRSCAVEGSILHVRDVDGSLIADIGAITISGPFIPVIAEDASLTTLPFSLWGAAQAFGAKYLISYREQPRRTRNAQA